MIVGHVYTVSLYSTSMKINSFSYWDLKYYLLRSPKSSAYELLLLSFMSTSISSSETQGADSEGVGKSKQAGKYAQKKSKERPEEPLGTMSYQTSSKRSPPFWLLIGARKLVFFWHPVIFLRPFRLSLDPLSAPGSPRMI